MPSLIHLNVRGIDKMLNQKNIINDLASKLSLEPHPEGGLYKEFYRSEDVIAVDERFGENQTRSASTAIYYLLSGKDFSALHRVKSDELWHYCSGDSITISYIDNKDGMLKHVTIGDPLQTDSAQFNFCVEKNTWFCAKPNNPEGYSLVTCTVSPGFDFRDFELADAASLSNEYPDLENFILEFTRSEKNITEKI